MPRGALAIVLGILGGCARPLLGPDAGEGSTSTSEASSDESTSTAPEPEPEPVPECHSSYSPCLPLVDDLNCTDVTAMGKAPVVVAGPDDYGLDADGDGIGCED